MQYNRDHAKKRRILNYLSQNYVLPYDMNMDTPIEILENELSSIRQKERDDEMTKMSIHFFTLLGAYIGKCIVESKNNDTKSLKNNDTKSSKKNDTKLLKNNDESLEEHEISTNNQGLCCICLYNRSSIACIPCNHLCMCDKCSNEHDQSLSKSVKNNSRKVTNNCPICRKQIVDKIKLYVC